MLNRVMNRVSMRNILQRNKIKLAIKTASDPNLINNGDMFQQYSTENLVKEIDIYEKINVDEVTVRVANVLQNYISVIIIL